MWEFVTNESDLSTSSNARFVPIRVLGTDEKKNCFIPKGSNIPRTRELTYRGHQENEKTSCLVLPYWSLSDAY